MSDINTPLSGGYVDERRVPPPPAGKTYARDYEGSYVSVAEDNGRAVLLAGTTEPPDPYQCAVSDYEDELVRKSEANKARIVNRIKGDLAQSGNFVSRWWNQYSLNNEEKVPLSEYVYDGHRTIGGTRSDDSYRMQSIESYYNQMDFAKRNNDPENFKKYCEEKNKINGQTSVTSTVVLENANNALQAFASRGGGGRGMRSRPPSMGVKPGGGALGPSRKPQVTFTRRETRGEPVAVATGEYLETWRDFFVPGALAFDGARYMGLKLGLPGRYANPLGSCQISMFDEIVSNPERGRLIFHSDDGKRIGFDRPFNFLPSQNDGYPNLELTAPWLKRLRLKDGPIVKHFRQYPDGFYRLEQIEDLNGLAMIFTRTETGVLTHAEGPDGLSLAFESDAHGQRSRVLLIGTDGSELELAAYAYDVRGRMVAAECAFGMSVRYEWRKDSDLLESWRDKSGVSFTRFAYDDRGRVLSTDTSGVWNGDRFDYREGRTDYLPGGDAAAAQNFQYDDNENITAEIDALGGEVRHRYDQAGFRISTTDANGHESRARYDSRGNLSEATDPEGRTTTTIWGDHGELCLVIDGAGKRTTYEHDDKANVIAETDADGNRTELVRDDKGRVVEKRFPSGGVERSTYDVHGRLATVADPGGHVTTFAYDAFNRLIAATDALGGVTRHGYAAGAGGFDTPSAIVRPDGVKAVRSFDSQGQIASVTDGEGRRWAYEHGAFGVPMAITDPKGGRLALSTDIEGRVTAVTNARGRTYGFERDKAGRVVAETDFDGRVTNYRRDPAGQVVEALKPDGARLAYAYDRSGLVTRIEAFRPDGRSEDVTRFWYDGRGLLEKAENAAALVTFERDGSGRIVAETSNGQRVASRRDADGARIARELVGVGRGLVETVRDPLGAVARLVVGERSMGFTRDALGRETRRETGGFALDQRFDSAGQLIGQRAGARGPSDGPLAAVAGRLYAYDGAFAPTSVQDTIWGGKSYFYDAGGQLTDAARDGGHEVFAYDEARNLVGAASYAPGAAPRRDAGGLGSAATSEGLGDWRSSPGGVVQIARGPSGEKLQLTHDACGRLVERRVERTGFRPKRWTYEWNAEGRLVACDGPDGGRVIFRYDAFGRRVAKVRRLVVADGRKVPSDTDVGTAYLWDGDHMIAEAPLRLSGAIDWGASVRWHFEEGGHRLLAREGPDGSLWPVVCDALGSPQEMFDERGALVWAADRHVWGAVRAVRAAPRQRGAVALAEALPFAPQPNPGLGPERDPLATRFLCPWRFPGQYEDVETGLFYNRHRHYDPLTAQYASPDPIGLAGGDRPQGYVANPTAWTDPLGLDARASYQRPAPTASANWGTARSNYWKAARQRELSNPSGKYSPDNLTRMEQGLAPRMTVVVKNRRTGRVSTRDISVELHHDKLPQRGASARANESWNLTPASPWAHEGMDPFRHTGYDLQRIIRGPNSWTPP